MTAIVLIPAVIGIFYTPYDTESMNLALKMASPSFSHPMGCDNYGRDIFSRIMKGSSITFLIGVGTVFWGSLIGTLVGAFTAYYGGVVDEILMRVNDVIFSFPSLLLALVFVAILGPGTYQVLFALAIAFIPSYARVVRGEFLRQKSMDYVQLARLAGAKDLRIMFVHILPIYAKSSFHLYS